MEATGGASQFKLDNVVTSLSDEYRFLRSLYDCQPIAVQRFIQSQARQLAEDLAQGRSQMRFRLPEQVVVEVSLTRIPPQRLPPEYRQQVTGSVINRITGADARTMLRERMVELEESSEKTVSAAARITRYAAALFMVRDMLPAGNPVRYGTGEGEEIPAISSGDANQFYLPQWVAFDQTGRLLVDSVNAAEACISSLQRYLNVLHTAVSLAPYIVADADYQQRRYGALGQLVNQGRLLAAHEIQEIIQVIRDRAAADDLNRGLSLSLPYFNDQDLEMRLLNFEVIPTGRVMFHPGFVVRAAQQEQAKVAQDTRLNPSTRKYLLAELKALETAFIEE